MLTNLGGWRQCFNAQSPSRIISFHTCQISNASCILILFIGLFSHFSIVFLFALGSPVEILLTFSKDAAEHSLKSVHLQDFLSDPDLERETARSSLSFAVVSY